MKFDILWIKRTVNRFSLLYQFRGCYLARRVNCQYLSTSIGQESQRKQINIFTTKSQKNNDSVKKDKTPKNKSNTETF